MDEKSQVCKLNLQGLLSVQGLGSVKKELQRLNSSKQIKPTCGRAQKPYFKTIKHWSSVSENLKTC